MTVAEIQQEIITRLGALSPADQKRVLEFVSEISTPQQGTPGKDLAKLAGLLDSQSAEEMRKAIEDGCERIEFDGW